MCVQLMRMFSQWQQGALQQLSHSIHVLTQKQAPRAKVTAPPGHSDSDSDGPTQVRARALARWRYTARNAADCLPYAFQLSLTNLCISCWPHDAPAWKMFEGLAPATRRLPIENRSLMINVASESQVLAISHLDTHNEQQTNINILLCMFGSKSFEHMSQ